MLLTDTSPDDAGMAVIQPSSEEMPAPARRGDRYQLFGEIARGGMGAVLKGRDLDLGRDLAVKVLLSSHRDTPELVRRFVEEAQIGGQLQHPGIVPVYELGAFADQRPYFTMKLVKGRTLAALAGRAKIARARPPAVPVDLRVDLPDDGLRACARGDPPRPEAVERDGRQLRRGPGDGLGPREGAEGWGRRRRAADRPRAEAGAIATVRSGSTLDESVAGSVIGTPAYMAPEQAAGDVERVDRRADVFGLGSILCEVLTGQTVYAGQRLRRGGPQGDAGRDGGRSGPAGRVRCGDRADRAGQGLPRGRAGGPARRRRPGGPNG